MWEGKLFKRMERPYYSSIIILAMVFIGIDIALLIYGSLGQLPDDIIKLIPAIQSIAMLFLVLITALNIVDIRKAEVVPHLNMHIENKKFEHYETLRLTLSNRGPGIAYDIKITNIVVENLPSQLANNFKASLENVPFIRYPASYLANPNYFGEDIIEIRPVLGGGFTYTIKNAGNIPSNQFPDVKICLQLSYKGPDNKGYIDIVKLTMGTYLHR